LSHFENFIEYDEKKQGTQSLCYRSKHISFWHHNLEDENVRNSFTKRCKRLLTKKNEDILFIRVLNDKEELKKVIKLKDCLSKYFTNFKLLIICENQTGNCVYNVCSNVWIATVFAKRKKIADPIEYSSTYKGFVSYFLNNYHHMSEHISIDNLYSKLNSWTNYKLMEFDGDGIDAFLNTVQ